MADLRKIGAEVDYLVARGRREVLVALQRALANAFDEGHTEASLADMLEVLERELPAKALYDAKAAVEMLDKVVAAGLVVD